MELAAKGVRVEDRWFASLDETIERLLGLSDSRLDEDVDLVLGDSRTEDDADRIERIGPVRLQLEAADNCDLLLQRRIEERLQMRGAARGRLYLRELGSYQVQSGRPPLA